MKHKIMFIVLALLVLVAPTAAMAAPAETSPAVYVPTAVDPAPAVTAIYGPYYDYVLAPTMQLSLTIDTGALFEGDQLMIDVLTNPYLFIAGLSLGVALLMAILAAIKGLRLS